MTRETLLANLSALKPTKKPLISWQASPEWFRAEHPMRPILAQMARIGGRITFAIGAMERLDGEDLAKACAGLAEETGAKVAFAFQPFTGYPNNTGDPRITGPIDLALSNFERYMALALDHIPTSSVTEILIDNERYVDDTVQLAWSAALLAMHNRFYVAAHSAVPAARFAIWESHCPVPQPNNASNPWPWKKWTTGYETVDLLDLTLNTLPNESGMREALARVKAQYPGTLAKPNPILAWVDLGAGIRQQPGKGGFRDTAWAYPDEYAYYAGQWLGGETRVTRIGFIVPPVENLEHPSWGHYIAFVQGMNGVIPSASSEAGGGK